MEQMRSIGNSPGQDAYSAVGLDVYNQALTGEVAMKITAKRTDPNHVPCVVLLEHHPNDSRLRITEDGICQTLNSRMGTGGGNVPLVMEIDDEDDCGRHLQPEDNWRCSLHNHIGGGDDFKRNRTEGIRR